MLMELLLLMWQKKATNLGSEENNDQIKEMQEKASSLEENLKSER